MGWQSGSSDSACLPSMRHWVQFSIAKIRNKNLNDILSNQWNKLKWYHSYTRLFTAAYN
jgi:hypothetical protein